MLKLLNRFAFIVSIVMGFLILFLFGILIDEMDGNYSFLDDDMFFMWVMGSTIIGMIFKKIFLSKSFIESRLEYFTETLNGRKLEEKNIATSIPKHEKVEKIEEPKFENIELNIEEEINYDIQEKNRINDLKEEKEIKEKEIKEEPSKIAIYIKKFFSENILAKLGAILVFLGVLFLMSLIWTKIPSVGKILIGFAIGFGIYIAGVILDNKGYTGESRILIGAGILINFLVILAGKHLLGNGDDGVISTGLAFIFLILNTIFAIVTSFVYKSRTLLIFSFIFAYLNPLLVGGSSDTPYLLVGYSMIVSLGALFIGFKNNDNILKYSAFILGNILFLIAPISYTLTPFVQEIAWIVKMVFTGALGFLTILTFYKSNSKSIGAVFVLNYIFIIMQLFVGGDIGVLNSSIGFITYMITILMFFFVGIWLFVVESMKSVVSIVLFPVLIILGILFTGGLAFIAPALAVVVLSYLIGFSFFGGAVSSFSKYFFFIILGGFIFVINSFIGFNLLFGNSIELPSFITVIIVSFVFLFTSYFFSRKKGLEYLYTIGTIGGIMTLLPVLFNGLYVVSQTIINISALSVVVFAISNQLLPFVNKNLTIDSKNTKNLIVGSIFGVLFIGFQLFIYGNKYFPGVALGFAFAGLAILYFILGFLMMNKLGVNNIKKEITPKNSILSYLFISVSLFSLAVALVFSNNPEIISTIWLFEASILFYFFSRTKEDKIFTIGLILFIIGTFNLFDLHNIVRSKDFVFLVPFSIIFGSLVFNLKNLNFVEYGIKRVSHDILHIIGIGILGSLLLVIIPSTGHGWSILGISIFVYIIGTIYAYFNSKILKIFFVIVLGSLMFLHLEQFNYLINRIDKDELSYLRILQYTSTLIISFVVITWNKVNKIINNLINNFVNAIFAIYLYFIVSNYVLDIFHITFAVTIFWGIVSSILLFYGISSDKIKYRTIGLYLLSIVLIKIFAYDIWNSIDDAVTRVIAFIGIGVLLIVISTRYTKKYGNNLKGEFDLQNLDNRPVIEEQNLPKTVKKNKKNNNKNITKEFTINEKIKDIDVSDIKGVEFIFAGKNIKIRAVNLLKIVKLIINNLDQKTSFNPGELKEVYNYVKDNYKSDLSKNNYNKIIDILEQFVNNGGDIKFIEK